MGFPYRLRKPAFGRKAPVLAGAQTVLRRGQARIASVATSPPATTVSLASGQGCQRRTAASPPNRRARSVAASCRRCLSVAMRCFCKACERRHPLSPQRLEHDAPLRAHRIEHRDTLRANGAEDCLAFHGQRGERRDALVGDGGEYLSPSSAACPCPCSISGGTSSSAANSVCQVTRLKIPSFM